MKKILIINPLFSDIFYSETRRVLSNYDIYEFRIEKGYYKLNYFHKLKNIFNRVFLNNKLYLIELEKKRKDKNAINALKQYKNQKFDKVLITRADRFSEKFIRNIRTISKELINYQCDGIQACPKIFKIRKYFDKVYSFELDDIINYPELQLQPITNFYFPLKEEPEQSLNCDFYYLGVGLEERVEKLKNFYAKNQNTRCEFHLTEKKMTLILLFIFHPYHILTNLI